jgi:phosphoribosyl-AMP cyclohydrolase / phosphoribosyl-ATP pyrophosphohydrolase
MTIQFSKYADGLVPCIVQDADTKVVLMLGFMNEEAFSKTQREGIVTFYSRSKHRLWTKGETSGHYLLVKEIKTDCDNDTILIKALPQGPVCHTGADTCFNEKNDRPAPEKEEKSFAFLNELERIITDRKNNPTEKSYTASLFAKGINKMAQKVGEEAVELVIEAKDQNNDLFLNEGADLLFHYLILLQAKGFTLQDIVAVLEKRHSGLKS